LEAEYTAVAVALRLATRLGVTRVVLETDRELLLRQITGWFGVKRSSLRSLIQSIMDIREASLREFVVNPISLSENSRAYELAYKALVTEKSTGNVEELDPMSMSPPGFQETTCRGGSATAVPVIIDPRATYRLQFDGGARGNPTGIAGAGVVIYDSNGSEVWCGWKFLDRMTNNCAEYCALLLGLRCARSLGIRSLEAEGDSELVVKQLKGAYRVKEGRLQGLWGAARAAMDEFDEIDLRYIPRKANKRADYLANCAMDEKSSHGFEEAEDAPPPQAAVM
jgi:ribonuclease HI